MEKINRKDSITYPEQDSTKITQQTSKDIMSLSLEEKSRVRSILNYSTIHFRCACLCAHSCQEIENSFNNIDDYKIQSDNYQNVQAYATGSILSIVAYLEAIINEFFNDCVDKSGNYRKNSTVNIDVIKKIEEYWYETDEKGKYKNRYKPILEKYRAAYKFIKGKGSHYSSLYYMQVFDLIELRNLLVHYEPRWRSHASQSDDPYKIKKLDGKFPHNKFRENSPNPFFPDKCLGGGCSIWAINNSEKFVIEFFNNIMYRRLGIDVGRIKDEILIL